MARNSKLSQLQIRVSETEKHAIRSAAERAGMDMSTYVLSRVLSIPAREFQEAVRALAGPAVSSFVLADINSLLSKLTAAELHDAVAGAPEVELPPFLATEKHSFSDDRKTLIVHSAKPARTIVDLVKWIDQLSIELADIHLKRPTLEDVFIELTGKKLRE